MASHSSSAPHPVPGVDNSYLDGFPIRSYSEEQARAHPRAASIPHGIPLPLIQSILFGLVLTDPWNHPDSCYVPSRGAYFFTSLPVADHKASLRDGDELVQALLVSIAIYDKDPVDYLRRQKAWHRCEQIVVRRYGGGTAGSTEEEGYVVAIVPPPSSDDEESDMERNGGGTAGGKAFIAFTGTKEWKHVKEALTYLPGTLNGVPTLSNLGCHQGYLSVAERVPDLISALQAQNINDIILCGHSRGGALAHLVLLLHLYRNDIRDDPEIDSMFPGTSPSAQPARVRAIAFGSPFVVNDSVTSFLAERNLHSRFLTVVNDGDVIPGVMSTLGGLSASDLSAIGGKAAATWVGVDVDAVLRTVGPLIVAATGYPIPAAVGATVGGLVWNSFWSGFVKSPVLTYRPVGKYMFLRKKYGSGVGGRPPEYLTTPDTTTSLESVLHHFQTMGRDFATRMAAASGVPPTATVAELYSHHSADSYLHGLRSTFSVPPLHSSSWRRVIRRRIADGPGGNLAGLIRSGSGDAYEPSEWEGQGGADGWVVGTPYMSVMEDRHPVLCPEALGPTVSNISGQQVLLPPVAAKSGDTVHPRKVKLEILGSNLDLLDMEEGILLERYFVDAVRFHRVVARTREKMIVEVTLESGIEKLPGRGNAHGPVVVFKSVHDGSKPIVKRLTSMTTVDAANPRNAHGTPTPLSGTSSLADGTVFDVAINAFKRAVIHRSHELRAAAMGFTAHREVQERLGEVKAAFERLEALCAPAAEKPPAATPAAAAAVGVAAAPVTTSGGAPALAKTGSSSTSMPGSPRLSAASRTSGDNATAGSTQSLASTGSAQGSSGVRRSRPLSELIEILARIDAFPDGDLVALASGAPLPTIDPMTGAVRPESAAIGLYASLATPAAGAAPTTKEEKDALQLAREREVSRIVSQTMDEATARCNMFLRALCSRIDITLEPSVYFVVGTGVVTGLVTALSIGLLLPEAPVIAAGIGMGFLTSTAVGPLGLGDTVVARAAHREQDNQYRFLLMELVKWVGVSGSDNARLEFLNAYTHERAIEERLVGQGFQPGRPDVLDQRRWMCWEEEKEETEELLREFLRRKGEERERERRREEEAMDTGKGEAEADEAMAIDVPNPWSEEQRHSSSSTKNVTATDKQGTSPESGSPPAETATDAASAEAKPASAPRLPPNLGGLHRRHGALFSEELFGPNKPFDRATRSSLFTIARRIDMVRQIHRIRRLIVEETVVALVGTQDAGKTTAARRLFPHVEKEFPARMRGGRVGGIRPGSPAAASVGGGQKASGLVLGRGFGGVVRRGMFEHTNGVRMFPQGRLVVSDFPGSDSTALSLDQAMRRFGGVASVALLFCLFNGDASGEVLRNLDEIKEWSSRIPILLCIHQAGNKVNSDPDSILYEHELTCPEDVDRFVLRWCDTIKSRFPGLTVTPALSTSMARDEEGGLDAMGENGGEESTASAEAGLKRVSLFDSPASSSKPSDKEAAGKPAAANGDSVVGPTTGITVAMTEFAKEMDLCRSFGIWGVREVRAWIRDRIAEGNVYISREDLLDALPDDDG
ncbi:hypothetical protein HDU96_009162 [Phlyctochytrium bullatum]|nr:hypothetical protein HDU96_009162 [Phlyctochytrium bullatum]